MNTVLNITVTRKQKQNWCKAKSIHIQIISQDIIIGINNKNGIVVA